MASKYDIYAQLDVSLPWHEKVQRIPEKTRAAAFGFYSAAVCFCQKERTDGLIRSAELARVFPDTKSMRLVRALVSAGLFDEVHGDYEVHDYLEYNKSRAEIEAEIEQRREAGKRGGHASGKARAKAGARASASASAQAESKQEGKQTRSKDEPIYHLASGEEETPLLSPREADASVFAAFVRVWEEIVCSVPSESTKVKIRSWMTMGYSEAAVRKALETARDNGAGSPADYATTVLRAGVSDTGSDDAYLEHKYGGGQS